MSNWKDYLLVIKALLIVVLLVDRYYLKQKFNKLQKTITKANVEAIAMLNNLRNIKPAE